MGQPGGDPVALLGRALAIFAVVALAAALVVQLQSAWVRIAVEGGRELDHRHRDADAWLDVAGSVQLSGLSHVNFLVDQLPTGTWRRSSRRIAHDVDRADVHFRPLA